MKICVVTGCRADYGLEPLIEKINEKAELQLIATGGHLASGYGDTEKYIKYPYEKVDIVLSSDSPVGISKAMGLAMIGFGEVYERLKPDMVVLLGDRFEIFCAAACAHVARIPIAHIHGGELTEGSIDDAFRHSITKFSRLHFTSADEYRDRVIQLGEHPDTVFDVGALGQDNLDIASDEELMSHLRELSGNDDFELPKEYLLIVFHPTATREDAAILEILMAVKKINMAAIFIVSNYDCKAKRLNGIVSGFCKSHKGVIQILSVPRNIYLALLKKSSALIGNSSSGIIEAPILGTGVVNIGSRQEGRIKHDTVFDCKPAVDDICDAIGKAVCVTKVMDYDSRQTAEQITERITQYNGTGPKKFYDSATTYVATGA